MAIVNNEFTVFSLDEKVSRGSRDSIMWSDEDVLVKRGSSVLEIENDVDRDGDEDEESGAGYDDIDILELGEVETEFCRFGSQNCSLPFELYDLPDLSEIVTMEAWNNCLTEEERFGLAKYLPDMDHEMFIRTLKELFSGSNFHFGSPLVKLFDMLKGGMCEPRVNLYQQGLNFFQKHEHYHLLRKYHNSMVNNLIRIRKAWENCKGFNIEERLHILNIMRNQSSLMYEKMEDLGLKTSSSEREESGEGFWSKRLKDIKPRLKTVRRLYTVSPTLDVPSHERTVTLEPAKYGKKNPNGALKVPSMKESEAQFPSASLGLETKSRHYASALALLQLNRGVEYDLDQKKGRGCEDDAEEPACEMNLHKVRNVPCGPHVGLTKMGKKQEFLKSKKGFASGRNKNVNQLADQEILTAKVNDDRPSYDYHSHIPGKKAKYSEKLQQSAVNNKIKTVKDHARHLLTGNKIDRSAKSKPFRHDRTQEEPLSVDHPVKFDDWNIGSKTWKVGQQFRTGENSVDLDPKVGSCKTLSLQISDTVFHSDYRAATSQKIRRKSLQNGGVNLEELRSTIQSEETESNSSGQIDEEQDISSSKTKLRYPSGVLEARRAASVKTVPDRKKANKLLKKDKKEYGQALGVTYSSKKVCDRGVRLHMPEVRFQSSKGKQKGKIRDSSYLCNNATETMEGNFSASGKLADDHRKQNYKFGKNGHMQGEPGERIQRPVSKAYPAERKQKRKGKIDQDYSVPLSNYIHKLGKDDDDLHVDNHELMNRLRKKGQNSEAHGTDGHERSKLSLSACNLVTKKRKRQADVTYVDRPDESEYLHSSPQQQIDGYTSLKKRVKGKVDAETGSLAMVPSEPLVSEKGAIDVNPETKRLKKPSILITPTTHTGFSFSIIHLLSAVRMAMVTPYAEDTSEVGKHLEMKDGRQKPDKEEQNRKHEGDNGVPPFHSCENVDANNSEHMEHKNLPSLTVQEIVNRVKSNPGDPCILETREPLQDLVRGVLKIFSSKTAPLGAKGWKTLIFYERSMKCWSWAGPVSSRSLGHDTVEEETSSEAWGLPYRMLEKLVDSFANWLKSGQETLQQIGSLPAPPMTLMQYNPDEKERFRDLRAQKSLSTINPSSEEVRAYFRREEVLRYLAPDRAFSYTAADGRKSIVAPLRRCGGKPTSKARDHFMLKFDRPPHVTILCLVRDAAARLPGNMGTRADVCTLIRDSQYIVEDVSDAQVNQVVSGALDRLHYELDPCVQFDGDRKIWVYLHREREEEDFEDDGTSSTKKWKRPRKDGTDQPDPGTVNVAYHGTGQQIWEDSAARYDLNSGLNVEPSSMHGGKRTELVYNDDSRPKVEENAAMFTGLAQGSMH